MNLRRMAFLSLMLLGLPVMADVPAGDNETTQINARWDFLPKRSDDSKFVFGLKVSKNASLIFVCDRGQNFSKFYYQDGEQKIETPDFDSVIAHTPEGEVRDSIVVRTGSSVEKVVKFFNSTSRYSLIFKDKELGPFSIAPDGSGDLGQNFEVCRGLPFRL